MAKLILIPTVVSVDVTEETRSHQEILFLFSGKCHISTLRMERDGPLKTCLLRGCKHVLLTTIYRESDCK